MVLCRCFSFAFSQRHPPHLFLSTWCATFTSARICVPLPCCLARRTCFRRPFCAMTEELTASALSAMTTWRAVWPPGLHTTTRELQTCTFQGPGASKHQNNEKDLQNSEERKTIWREREKRAKLAVFRWAVLGRAPLHPSPCNFGYYDWKT